MSPENINIYESNSYTPPENTETSSLNDWVGDMRRNADTSLRVIRKYKQLNPLHQDEIRKTPAEEKKLKKIWRQEKNDYLCNPQTGAISGA